MNDKLIIYSIVSLHFKAEYDVDHKEWKQDWSEWRDSYCGFYSTFEKAEKVVLEDAGGFSEAHYYDYIVIQREVEGLYNLNGLEDVDKQVEWWYHHDEHKNCWLPCEKPESLKGLINFH